MEDAKKLGVQKEVVDVSITLLPYGQGRTGGMKKGLAMGA